MIRLRLLVKVDLIFHYVANTDGGDHAVQHKADTTDDAGRNGVDDGFKLGAELRMQANTAAMRMTRGS